MRTKITLGPTSLTVETAMLEACIAVSPLCRLARLVGVVVKCAAGHVCFEGTKKDGRHVLQIFNVVLLEGYIFRDYTLLG